MNLTRFLKYFAFVGLIFILVNVVIAQNSNEEKQKVLKAKAPSKIKLVADKPNLSIDFEKQGEWQPFREGESGKGFWLRLHNNMKYSIRFCAFGVAEGVQLAFHEKDSQLIVKYDVEVTDSSLFDKTKRDVPIGFNTGDFCHYFELDSGKSVLFAVSKEHLEKGLSIKIPFHYEWEEDWENNPTHFVYFNSLKIPK